MKKILISLSIVGAVAAIAIGATTAFFSDTETSTGNTFTAGAIDLTIDSQATFKGEPVEAATWTLRDLVPTADKFFNFSDIKPGDIGENTISLHVDNNDAWGCVNIIPTKNDDVSSTEPELEAAGETQNTDSIFDGELAQNMTFKIWADMCSNIGEAHPGDNIYTPGCDGDRLLTQGAGPIVPTTYALATPQGNVFTGQANDPIDGSQTNFLGVEWGLPFAVGNIVQTDSYQADVSFYVEQSRNNTGFVCPNAAPIAHTLRLENETIVQGGPWTVINDNTFATLTWKGNGPTFDYDLIAQGLAENTDYSLIYYADGWPGNNPGAFIGNGTSDDNGDLSFSDNLDLNTDLPESTDGNYAVGAKIWLVLSSDYNSDQLSTGPMTAWNPGQYLFEGNVYIHYDDTDH